MSEYTFDDRRLLLTNFERPPHVAHLTPGQMFADSSGDLCIYLGWAPEHMHHGDTVTLKVRGETISCQELSFRPQHVVLYYYKRTWCTADRWPTEIRTSEHDLSTLLLQEQPKYFR